MTPFRTPSDFTTPTPRMLSFGLFGFAGSTINDPTRVLMRELQTSTRATRSLAAIEM